MPGHEDGFWVGPTLIDRVTPEMSVYRDEIFGPVLVLLRAETFDDALELVNSNPYGNGSAIFTADGRTAREFEQRVQTGMVGVNVPIPVPMAYYSFGGWKQSLFGDLHVHGREGVLFYTRGKVVTERWPDQAHGAALRVPGAQVGRRSVSRQPGAVALGRERAAGVERDRRDVDRRLGIGREHDQRRARRHGFERAARLDGGQRAGEAAGVEQSSPYSGKHDRA